jgi:N-acetylmuramoyl-L-alanine amidase
VDCLAKGSRLEVTDMSNSSWYAVEYQGIRGFMSSGYIALDEHDYADIPVTGGNTENAAAYINAMYVRFRSGPGSQYSVLAEYNKGKALTITGVSGDWTAVLYNGTPGYIYSQYVKEGEYKQPETPSVDTSATGSELGRQIADFALQYVGYNYCWGGKSPDTGFDCSGLVYYVYQQYGYTLNRVAADQALNGVHVDDLQPGDVLCFYSGNSYIGHSGIYIGDGKFVHAANSATGVIVTSLEGYYSARGYEARRIV